MKLYLKDKRIENAVVEVKKESVILDKQVISCLLESIYETFNHMAKEIYIA